MHHFNDTHSSITFIKAIVFVTVAAMRLLLSGTVTILAVLNSVCAWGGLFNRFSPEMLSNLGYGSHGGYRAQPFLQVSYDWPFATIYTNS
jgi:hypothetical protein